MRRENISSQESKEIVEVNLEQRIIEWKFEAKKQIKNHLWNHPEFNDNIDLKGDPESLKKFNELTDKKLRIEEFFLRSVLKSAKNYQEVLFDLDFTLIYNDVIEVDSSGKLKYGDVIRPAAEFLIKELKKQKKKVGIFTMRFDNSVPEALRRMMNTKIITRNLIINNKKSYHRYNLESNKEVLTVDDLVYAKSHKNCFHVSSDLMYFADFIESVEDEGYSESQSKSKS